VTALEQQVTVGDERGGSEDLTGVLETDAGGVPGDSGGPMFDAEGEALEPGHEVRVTWTDAHGVRQAAGLTLGGSPVN